MEDTVKKISLFLLASLLSSMSLNVVESGPSNAKKMYVWEAAQPHPAREISAAAPTAAGAVGGPEAVAEQVQAAAARYECNGCKATFDTEEALKMHDEEKGISKFACKDTECVICYLLLAEDARITSFACGHAYHTVCVERSERYAGGCTLCTRPPDHIPVDPALIGRELLGVLALHQAAMTGWGEAIGAIIRLGTDVNATTADGVTALHWACAAGQAGSVVQLLRFAGINPNIADVNGFTPLHCVAANPDLVNSALLLTMLLQAPTIDVNAQDMQGFTPLSLAVNHGHEVVVRALLNDDRVNLEARNSSGMTPLILAASYGRSEIVQVLLEAGADINAVDNAGYRALYWAQQHTDAACARLLEGYRPSVRAKCKSYRRGCMRFLRRR